MKQRNNRKRILFATGDRDAGVTNYRLLELANSLAANPFDIDVVTCDEELVGRCRELFEGSENIRYAALPREERFWTMAQRDGFAKTFIKLNHDLEIPGVDLKFWKMTGFDDFLWNTSSTTYPDISEHYDAVIVPIPSFSEGPPARCDVFYTHVIFHAKQNAIPVIGLQIYPIYDVPPIYPMMIDHFVVKGELEGEFYRDLGIPSERISVVDDVKENYCLSTVQDSYRNLTIDKELEVPRDAMGIVVINHSRNRFQLYDVLEVIGEFDKPKSVFFVMVNFSVKELHEQDIFKDLTQPVLEKTVKSYYTVETGALIKCLMLCDAIIATNYIVPLSFAGQYGKRGIVYNPLITESAHVKGVLFTNTKQALREALYAQYEHKRSSKTVSDIVRGVVPCH
jgi:hypothetical protein